MEQAKTTERCADRLRRNGFEVATAADAHEAGEYIAGLAERPDADVTLVESDSRKAAFLREAARLADLPVTVVPSRIEQVAGVLAPGVEVVSARALAPLPRRHPGTGAG